MEKLGTKNESIEILKPLASQKTICVELFMAGSEKTSNLPLEVATNPKLIEQAQERRNLYKLFDKVFEAISDPGCDIEKAEKNGAIMEQDVALLWNGISNLLERDENNARILLYLPFEILPNLHNQKHYSQQTEAAGQKLANLYKQNWIKLLFQDEPRANFVDGDILEPGLPEPERISKAGHLVPELLTKDIITKDDVSILLESIKDEKFLKSITEGVFVSVDRGLLDVSCIGNLKTYPATVNEEFNNPDSSKISPYRAAWLKSVERENKVANQADIFCQKILGGENLNDLIEQTELEVAALGIIKTGEFLVTNNPKKAKKFASKIENTLQAMLDSENTKAKNAIILGLNRWTRLGITNSEFLQKFGINLTDLSLPTQSNNPELSKEFENLLDAAVKIQKHPLLAKYLYPGFSLFGSRLKGYARTDSDFDAAIFFRPEAKTENRAQVLETLKRDVPELAKICKFLEFWVTKNNGTFGFTVPQEGTRTFIGEEQIHFLMGGAWVGFGTDFNKIRKDIALKYLDLSRYGEQKEEVRGQLLGQIELDALQYRLMHKGYRKFYPTIDKPSTKNSDLIDWKSDFWDPGYRRVATKLFLSRVFLPDLS